MTVEQGHDPREFVFIAFGGAGPLHGAALMDEIEIGRMLLPPHPGVLCAIGCAVADVRHDLSQTVESLLPGADEPEPGRLDPVEVEQILRLQREAGEQQLAEDAISFTSIEVLHKADMAYEGQVHRLRVSVDPDCGVAGLRSAFLSQYRREYGTLLEGVAVTVVNLRTIVTGRRTGFQTGEVQPGAATPTPVRRRLVHFGEWIDTPIYVRADLGPGAELEGPAIIEQPDTTAVIEPGMRIAVDPHGNVMVTRP
jgi:N-methylhydantoinase A